MLARPRPGHSVLAHSIPWHGFGQGGFGGAWRLRYNGPMPHNTPLITTLVAALTAALLLGVVARKLRLPPLVGYLVAGVLIGPYTPGFVGDLALAGELAEIGIILLMFGVGLHFSSSDWRRCAASPCPARWCRSRSPRAGWGWRALLGWTDGQGLVFGICLSVASTVVLLRALQERGVSPQRQDRGRLAGGGGSGDGAGAGPGAGLARRCWTAARRRACGGWASRQGVWSPCW